MKDFHVCFCIDNNYLKHASVLMYTILKNSNIAQLKNSELHNEERYVFHIISSELFLDEQKAIFKNLELELNKIFKCCLVYHYADESVFKQFNAWSTDNAESYATYLRLLIPSLLDKNIDKCLYLDCDMICMGDLRELFYLDISKYAAAAVPARFGLDSSMRFKSKTGAISLTLNFDIYNCYFNAGLILINLDYWRTNDIPNQCIKVLSQYVCNLPDQDALNIVLQNKIKYLPIYWNYHNSYNELASKQLTDTKNTKDKSILNLIIPYINSQSLLESSLKIYHFLAQPKPWWVYPFKCDNGNLYIIESKYLRLYQDAAFNTPVFSDYFKNLLAKQLDYDLSDVVAKYSIHLSNILSNIRRKHRKLSKRLITIIIILLTLHIIELSAIFYIV